MIKVEKTEQNLFRVTGEDARLHVVGETLPEALRRAAGFLEDLDRIASEEPE